jgi:hypothetical protein
MVWTSKSVSFSWMVETNPGKLRLLCLHRAEARDQEQQVHLALATLRLRRPEVVVGPHVAEHAGA